MAESDSLAEKYEKLDPDVRLMLQVRDDNAAAFEELVSRYQNRLITIFDHMIGKRDQAEDLAQEVFLRIYRARKRYTPRAKFSTWLFTIANNVASNALRTLSRRKEVTITSKAAIDSSAEPLDHMAMASSGLMPTRRADNAEEAEMVRTAISKLNERQRLALLLCKFEGMSYAEIADSMELSTPAVKSLLSRARTNLRVILEPYMDEGLRPDATNASKPLPSRVDEVRDE